MSRQTQFDKLDLLGIEVDAISVEDAISFIIAKSAPKQPPAYVIKPYVEFLDKAYRNEQLTNLLNEADLSLADGVAITWAAAYLYAGKRSLWRYWLTLFQIVLSPNELRWPLPDRAAGTNFTLPLLSAASSSGRKVFLIGDPKTSHGISATAEHLKKAFPTLEIVGTLSGRDPSQKSGQVSETWLSQASYTLEAVRPDIILVGMGFPLQEQVMSNLTTSTKHGVYIGEGGTFDYEEFGGTLTKAPPQLQRLGLEWLWRLTREPTRLWRQLAIPRFLYRIWKSSRS